MIRGRKPKPTHLKLVTGNPGKRRLNRNEPMPELAIPMPPAELNDDAKVEWGRLSHHLFRMGLLTELDRGPLACVCQSYGRWMQAERLIAEQQKRSIENGLLAMSAKRNVIQNPLLAIARAARADYIRYAIEFGLTPSSRARVSVPPASRPGNPFAGID